MAPTRACIGLGSNLGDAAGTLRAALLALRDVPQTRFVGESRLYRTPAWGMTSQPDFVNGAALVDTDLDAQALLGALLAIERAAGRERGEASGRWGPRILDLDLLLYGDRVIDLPGLMVPHPRMHERAFVLVPLLELDPDAVIPGRGRVATLLEAMATDEIQALG
ncbi:MAG: 2-amino-4-hydroxy-6-hydroxymethyldihydropteridine diphosphokinase [Pseudomonadota bacterium]|nr:2-amino-4-hydroxy-6-hydroxymethyldihydropteridine diphosphokinase [Pseudomonadota bacterium]